MDPSEAHIDHVTVPRGAEQPLHAMRVVEFASLGPVPFAAMILADHGADVVRITRPDTTDSAAHRSWSNPIYRNRPWLSLDLKAERDRDLALQLIDCSDVVLEGYRPGVMERLDLGPERCRERNPGLVFARVTGWGQDGPYRHVAGHDIDYLAVSGALFSFRSCGCPPQPPMNLVGDYGGGGMLAAFSVLAAWTEARETGIGRTLDVSMLDGINLLMTLLWGRRSAGDLDDQVPGTNRLAGDAPFYGVYETKDGRHLAVGAVEPGFRRALLRTVLGDDSDFEDTNDPVTWSKVRDKLASAFALRTASDWLAVLEHTDACVAPVLSMSEALDDPQQRARGSFVDVNGTTHPRPAPAFRDRPQIALPRPVDVESLLDRWASPT